MSIDVKFVFLQSAVCQLALYNFKCQIRQHFIYDGMVDLMIIGEHWCEIVFFVKSCLLIILAQNSIKIFNSEDSHAGILKLIFVYYYDHLLCRAAKASTVYSSNSIFFCTICTPITRLSCDYLKFYTRIAQTLSAWLSIKSGKLCVSGEYIAPKSP